MRPSNSNNCLNDNLSIKRQEHKSYVRFKFSAAAWKAIENFQITKNDSSKMTIKFDESGGILSIPTKEKTNVFNFDLSEDRSNSFVQCVQQDSNSCVKPLGMLKSKIQVHPSSNSFANTMKKMADQRKQFCSKVIETDISNPEMRRRKINPKPKLPAVKNSVPEIRQQHISDRIVHILAVNECDKNEMMERLEIDGLSAKEKINVGKTLNHVSILKNNMYHLKDDMWSRIQDDWKFYSPEDAIKVKKLKKYHCKDIPSVNQVNAQNSMKKEEMDPYPSAKKQRISHFNLRSNSITEVSPKVSSGASQNLINNSANSNLHKKSTSKKKKKKNKKKKNKKLALHSNLNASVINCNSFSTKISSPESFSGLSSFSVSPEYQIKRPQVQSSNNRPVKLTNPKNISENAFGMQPFHLELNHHYQNKNYQQTSQFLASSNKEPITSVNPTSAVESVSNVLTFTSETENKSIQRTPQILSSFDESTVSTNPENAVKTLYNIFSFTSECENKNTQQIAQILPSLNEQPSALANPYALETLSNASTCTSECENKVTQKTPQILPSLDDESMPWANPEFAVETLSNLLDFTTTECENKNTQQTSQMLSSFCKKPVTSADLKESLKNTFDTLDFNSYCKNNIQKTSQILPSINGEHFALVNPEGAAETLSNVLDFTTTECENKNAQHTSQILSSFCKKPVTFVNSEGALENVSNVLDFTFDCENKKAQLQSSKGPVMKVFPLMKDEVSEMDADDFLPQKVKDKIDSFSSFKQSIQDYSSEIDKKFIKITSIEQRYYYKTLFNQEYLEYLKLSGDLSTASNAIGNYLQHIDACQKESEDYIYMMNELHKEYKTGEKIENLMDAVYRWNYMHIKLDRIRNLIREYDNES
ncbi:RNA polymerase II elongation factor ELL2 [Caerostris darwini]|uniref:RNA polymerase II elongation factor ELL2 n=1 Tax=Caerostris darwini TaxID=1538125 RepID=A0AAV4X5D3_9ARAC|nr:RNA polymerase II elongation factor ELL2 [Caerostris darwini]